MITKEELQNIRAEYASKELLKSTLADQPIDQFALWFKEALEAKVREVNAMNLATCDENNRPSARIVLLKSFDENGFVFFTNYKSEKGQHMAENLNVALTFFWPELERQVRVEGEVEKTSKEESLAYFKSRPRLSQLGAIVSQQSTEIANRELLQAKMDELTNKYEGKEIPMPVHWGGYLVKPSKIEFWQGRPGRLHDRLVYEKQSKNNWSIKRLCP